MSLFQDIRFAARTLRKAPAFVLVATLTLGIGIGANTVIFSVAQKILLHSIEYPQQERLAFVSRGYPGFPQGGGNFTYPAYRDMLQQNTSFDELAAFQSFGALALTEKGEAVRVNINYVTPSYFQLLGTETAFGRVFRREEDRWADADPVMVLSYGFWLREFGGNPGIVGQVIHLNEQPFTVIGVAAQTFHDTPGAMDTGEAVDAWLPLGLSFRLTGLSDPNNRNAAILWGIGHLKPGVSAQQAQADFEAINQRITKAYPATDAGFTLVVKPLKDQLVGQFYRPLWLLLGGSIFILLIACANVANLLLARLIARQRELAVRGALGATQGRLARQMLAENVVLLALAAAVGIGMAYIGLKGLHAWGRLNLPEVAQFGLDHSMIWSSVAASLLTLLVFGFGPAIVGSRTDFRDALNQSGRSGMSLSRKRAPKVLIAVEVALAFVLLTGAGLLVKSLRKMTTIDLGFDTRNLLTLRLDLNAERYAQDSSRLNFTTTLLDNLRSIPGVSSASVWGPGMPGRATWVIEAIPEGRQPDDPRSIVMSARHSVNPGALSSIGIPLLRGRDFTWHDDADATPVAIVSESTAKASWPGEDPLGKRFLPIGKNKKYITVVGVTADAKLRQRLDLADAAIGIRPGGLGPQLDVYLPYPQRANRALVIALRVQGDPATLLPAIRSTVAGMDPTLPVYDVQLLDDRLAAQDTPSRAMTAVTGSYALVALFLASLGLFGVLAHAVSRRTQELGLRMALGARQVDLLLMVMREGFTLVLTGIAAGFAGAILLTRLMRSLLFGVNSTDPAVYFAISLVLLLVALTACYLPAWRATRVDPMVALHYE
jgi:putative ABC transport system permease protein